MNAVESGENKNLHRHPDNLLDLLVEHSAEFPSRYPISRIARILNRGSYGNYIQRKLPLRGQFAPTDLYQEYEAVVELFKEKDGFKTSINHFVESGGRRVQYIGMTFPGWSHGEELYGALDEKFETLEASNLSEDEAFQLAAFTSIAVGAIHAFSDGNGRTARGAAAFVVQKFTDKKIDMDLLLKRRNEWSTLQKGAGYRLLPGEYNPQYNLSKLRDKKRKYAEVVLPSSNNNLSADIPVFLRSFADSINNFIREFDFPLPEQTEYASIEGQIKRTADFYKEVSVSK